MPEIEEITGIDVNKPRAPLPKKTRYIQLDIRSPEIFSAMAGHDVVVHTAFVVTWPAKMPAKERDDININGARNMARAAVAKVEPRVLLTDGLGSYGPAARHEFPDAVHVAGVGLQGRLNNNRMERYHGTFKERTKVMRAIKTQDSATLDGQRIYYNHLRDHQALGKTPAQAAGLDLNLGKNKWESLIKKASKSESAKQEMS